MAIKYIDFINLKKELKKIESYTKNFDKILVQQDGVTIFEIQQPDHKDFQLEYLLKKVGKSIFVEYYSILKSRDDAYKYLPAKYSIHSRKLRQSAAKQIFELGLEKTALDEILSSKRLPQETLNKANSLVDGASKVITLASLIKDFIPVLLQDGLFNDKLDLLQEEDYCKEHIGIHYPLLKEVTDVFNKNRLRKDEKGYPRYYKQTITVKGTEYLLCSHWDTNRHMSKVEHWLTSILKETYQKKNSRMNITDYFTKYSQYMTSNMLDYLKE